jgi:hypothetical protein
VAGLLQCHAASAYLCTDHSSNSSSRCVTCWFHADMVDLAADCNLLVHLAGAPARARRLPGLQ